MSEQETGGAAVARADCWRPGSLEIYYREPMVFHRDDIPMEPGAWLSVDVPPGYVVDHVRVTAPLPPELAALEERRLELEAQSERSRRTARRFGRLTVVLAVIAVAALAVAVVLAVRGR